MRAVLRIAPDVGWLPISFVNVYFVGRPGGDWFLVDAGLSGTAEQILEGANARFGASSPPQAIVLTHGHFDHVGAALDLAEEWNVPIYVHPLELPYLTGRSKYPPPDPTVGGAIAFLSRFMPSRPPDLSGRVQPLDGQKIAALEDWDVLHTPGHSPGHISLFRKTDRVLLAGDAFATMDMDSWTGLVTGHQMLSRAGAPFNCDWQATTDSLQRLAELKPDVVGCGHGIPITEGDLAERLETFASRFVPPRQGRYVEEAAVTDETGVVALPRAPFDPVPFATVAGLIGLGIALGAGYLDDQRKRR